MTGFSPSGTGETLHTPKLTTIYVLLTGIVAGLIVFTIFFCCCKKCVRQRLRMEYIFPRERKKDWSSGGEKAGGDCHQSGTTACEKAQIANYIVTSGGLQRKSEESQRLSPSRSSGDGEFFQSFKHTLGETCRGTNSQTHFFGSTTINIEPAQNKSCSSSSSTSLNGDIQKSEPPSPRSFKNRKSGVVRSHSSRNDNKKGSTKSTRSFRRHYSGTGSLKDPRSSKKKGGSGDPNFQNNQLTVENISPRRRSVSLRSPRSHHQKTIQDPDRLMPSGLWIGSENSVYTLRKFVPSPTISTHSIFNEITPLEAGLDWWKTKHKIQRQLNENKEPTTSEIPCQIRYNDIGSMEELQYSDASDMFFDRGSNESSPFPSEALSQEFQPQKIKYQYRALWELRATLEEQSLAAAALCPTNPMFHIPDGPSLSPTILPPPKEEPRSIIPDRFSYSPEPDPFSSQTTSFESNTEAILTDDQRPKNNINKNKESGGNEKSQAARRQSFKNVLHNRMLKKEQRKAELGSIPGPSNIGNQAQGTSFDSIDSTSTETSRLEALTTSLESTDSADNNQPFLHMARTQIFGKNENSYKILEKKPSGGSGGGGGGGGGGSNNSPKLPLRFFPPYKKNIFSNNNNINNAPVPETFRNNSSLPPDNIHGTKATFVNNSNQMHLTEVHQRSQETRRALNRFERHSIASVDSVEPFEDMFGGNITLNPGGGEKAGNGNGKAKNSVFYKYFRSPRSSSAYYSRDYSIDEKSDKLFREFSRCDPALETNTVTRLNSLKAYNSLSTATSSNIPPPISRESSVLDKKNSNPIVSTHSVGRKLPIPRNNFSNSRSPLEMSSPETLEDDDFLCQERSQKYDDLLTCQPQRS